MTTQKQYLIIEEVAGESKKFTLLDGSDINQEMGFEKEDVESINKLDVLGYQDIAHPSSIIKNYIVRIK